MRSTEKNSLEQLVQTLFDVAEGFLTDAQVLEFLALGFFRKPIDYVIARNNKVSVNEYERTSTLVASAFAYTIGFTIPDTHSFQYVIELLCDASDDKGVADE